MFIFEIILTVIAWRRGWGARALIPVSVAAAGGFLIGIGAAASGGTIEQVMGPAILLELFCFVALVYLAVTRRQSPVAETAPPALGHFGAPAVVRESH